MRPSERYSNTIPVTVIPPDESNPACRQPVPAADPNDQPRLRTALFYTRVYNRARRPGLAMLNPAAFDADTVLLRRFNAMNDAINAWCDQAKPAA